MKMTKPPPATYPAVPPHRSEVARLMEQIERESQMMQWASTGLVEGIAKHLFINRRYEAMGRYQRQLGKFVGSERSIEIMCEIG